MCRSIFPDIILRGIFTIIFSFSIQSIQAQVTQNWVARYNGPVNTNDEAYSVAVDDTGNVYVTGGSSGNTSSCMTTIKYNPSGVQQWVARYYGIAIGPNEARCIKLDRFGNVYVTGSACVSSPAHTDLVVIKYNSAGTQQWLVSYHPVTDEGSEGMALAFDIYGYIYAAGSTNMTPDSADFVTIKYIPSGAQQWVRIYDGPTKYIDIAYRIAADYSGNIITEGISWINQFYYEYAIVKYSGSGVEQWVVRQFGSDDLSRWGNGIAVDHANNIYLTGTSGYGGIQDMMTVKFDQSGYQKWIAMYSLPVEPTRCEGSAVFVDTGQNVYVTGFSDVTSPIYNTGCVTVKYNSSGVQQWAAVYNGPTYSAFGRRICLDADKNVYVGGYSADGPQLGYDYLTLKYDSNGIQKWAEVYDNAGSDFDFEWDMTIDKDKNVYVTGQSGGVNTGDDFATIKYSQPIGIHSISSSLPKEYKLYQNYPNPFNPSTKIRFELRPPLNPLSRERDVPLSKEGTLVSLIIYDILGREVATLVDEQLKPGSYEVEWDASAYPSGVYFYRLQTESFSETKKLILSK